MHEIINEKVSVITVFDRNRAFVFPQKIRWQGRIYRPNKLGYHYKIKEGKKLIHIFSVSDQTMCFKLKFDSENLHWTLEEVSDGLAS